jgi:pyroglutamyl-peptidase
LTEEISKVLPNGHGDGVRILVTAFEPYDHWEQNSSWEVLVEYLRVRGTIPNVVTRRYPVDLKLLQSRLDGDLSRGFDVVLHLGQSPGISQIHLESIAVNVAGMTQVAGNDFGELLSNAPVAYRSKLPLGAWAGELRSLGIPASVSYHAGTYLCNAAMFLSMHWFESHSRNGQVGFIHLPLTHEQVLKSGRTMPSLSKQDMARAIQYIVDGLVDKQRQFDFA